MSDSLYYFIQMFSLVVQLLTSVALLVLIVAAIVGVIFLCKCMRQHIALKNMSHPQLFTNHDPVVNPETTVPGTEHSDKE